MPPSALLPGWNRPPGRLNFSSDGLLADKNDPRAEFYLGMMYLLRTDESQDYAEAAKWFLRAAQQDYTTRNTTLA
jgi:TPR repeat protein